MRRVKIKRRAAPKRRTRTRRRGAPSGDAALAAFAHDIRTALTGILAFGELLLSSDLGERERRWAVGVKATAEHLASLTTLALDARRAEAGAVELQEQPFRPRQLFEVLAETLAARAETKELKTEVAIADDLPDLLVGDSVRLRAAVENLLDNAVKFTEHGTVRLAVQMTPPRRDRVRLIVTVSDSGIGMTAAEARRLFRPFGQANPEIARRYGGTGLGLVVVKALAKLMGGDLKLASTPGRGSRFQFTAQLPLAPGAPAQSDAERQAVPTRPLKVLCTEDNPFGRVILNTILTELGHKADFVGSGEAAVQRVTRGYDAVLMDATLPGIDGLEATRRIRALAGPPGRTPIIGVSGRTEAGDEDAALAAGMNSYLRKPLSPRALSAILAAVVPAD